MSSAKLTEFTASDHGFVLIAYFPGKPDGNCYAQARSACWADSGWGYRRGHLPFAQFFVIFLSLQSLGRAFFNLSVDAKCQVFELGTFGRWWLRGLGYN